MKKGKIKKNKPRVIVFSGYGLNCEEETAYAFELAGAEATIVHINDVIEKPGMLRRYQILAMPGGFSYGDDTGSGRAYGNKIKNNLKKELEAFIARDTLTIGICNGFQILTHVGLLPGSLIFNDNARYTDRWVDLRVGPLSGPKTPLSGVGESPWLKGIKKLSVPIAHGEGKYFADEKTLKKLNPSTRSSLGTSNAIAFTYEKGEVCEYQDLPENPNGSLLDIAAVTSHEGRVLGMMPHPERAISFTQLPYWPYLKEKLSRTKKPIPKVGPGLELFKNAVRYFSRKP